MEIESGVNKKQSQELSRTESHFLGALSKLDEFLLKPQERTLSGTVPGISRNTDVTKTTNQKEIVPRMILIRKSDPQGFSPNNQSIHT